MALGRNMSTRVLKKLKGRDDELKALAALAEEASSEESDHDNAGMVKKPSNPFALVSTSS